MAGAVWRSNTYAGQFRSSRVSMSAPPALTLLICGDGFFKTISAIVATLYPIDLFRDRIWVVRNVHEGT